MMRHVGGEEDMNWLRLWAFNGADDGLISLQRANAPLQGLATGFLPAYRGSALRKQRAVMIWGLDAQGTTGP